MRALYLVALLGAAIVLVGIPIQTGPSDIATALHDMPCGDLDNDGDVDSNDINIESTYIGQTVPPAPPEVDQDSNGIISLADLSIVISQVGPASCQDAGVSIGYKGCKFDVNKDGAVTVADIVIVISPSNFFLPVPPADVNADVSNSGAVTVFDLVLVVINFGTVC